MNILTAVKQLTFVAKLFAAAKLDLNAMVETGDETALAAHLATISAPAKVTADHPDVAAFIKTALDAKVSEMAKALGHASALNAGFLASGITLKAADEAKGITAEEVTAAVQARASILAQESLAKRGLAEFPGSTPAADPTKPAAQKGPELTGRARTEAAFKAQREARA